MSRFTVRTRLTLVHGGLFVVAGTALVAFVYLLMRFAPRYVFPTPAAEESGARVPTPMPTAAAPLDISDKEDVLRTLLLFSGLGLAVLGVAALALGWWISGRVLAPLHDITATARAVASGNLHERIGLQGPADELKHLADTFDAMLARLDAAFEAQRRFTANASHELRTPLATTRTMLQVALADPEGQDLLELGRRLLETNQRSIDITEALLTLTLADHGLTAADPADLARLVAEVVAAVDPGDVTLTTSVRPATVVGDATLLRQLVGNLVTNAVRHNHPGGRAEVRLTQDSFATRLTVTNTGPLLSAADLALIVEPFHRLAPRTARTAGHGLGLPIVRSIVEAHRGVLAMRPVPGGGLEVTVTLPG
ncbi:sensor histidine kinase [Nonomuraea sp. NPDC050328]|uniref:sensor histidine kinase n=1 Tax=Nonomuraea sp. NPDC050328 TaxID=3364361 RepID=UPI0037B9E33A